MILWYAKVERYNSALKRKWYYSAINYPIKKWFPFKTKVVIKIWCSFSGRRIYQHKIGHVIGMKSGVSCCHAPSE